MDQVHIQRQEKNKKTTLTLIMLVGIFTVSTAPLHCLMMADMLLGTSLMLHHKVVSMLAFCNPLMNPVLYGYRVPVIKEGIVILARNVCCSL